MTELTIEELLEIASQKINNEQVDPYKKTSLHDFLIDNNICEGTDLVDAGYIWMKYKQWRPKAKKMNKSNFFHNLAKIFKKKRTAHSVFYYLDSEPFDLSENGYWEMRKFIREEHHHAKQKNEKKSS